MRHICSTAIPDATARAKIFGATARELYFNGE
jgi:hypothetical protein